MKLRQRTPDLLVVGGGPAGMSAACAAARCGANVVLIDESPELGGQIYRVPLPGSTPGSRPDARGEALRRSVSECPSVEVLRETSVLGAFEEMEIAIETRGEASSIVPRAVVVATGAHEFAAPFPGWTLPGVMTPGAAQILAKTMGVAAGQRAVVAGTGPFLLAVALQLHQVGVEVVSVLEASPNIAWWKLPLRGWRTPGLLMEGAGYLRALRRAGIPLRRGRIVVEAEGEEHLSRVVHSAVDADWCEVEGTRVDEDVDVLCTGYGFVPRVELAQMLGCALEHRPEIGGWVPKRDAEGRSSVEKVWIAGDGGGIAGAAVAALEGELCGQSAACELGFANTSELRRTRHAIERRLARMAPMRAALDAISRPRHGLERLARADTEVCRCEEVTQTELRDAVEHGGTTYRSLKVATRIGMGPCQGRFCWPAVSRAVAEQVGCEIAQVGASSPRPPLRPVRLGALADVLS